METRLSLTRPGKASGSLSVQLIGEIKLQRGATVITLPASKRTRALLGFLAATAVPQPRQLLCDLLWEGPDDPRAALRWSLTKLRPLVNEEEVERLLADREHVSFVLDKKSIDVGRIDDLLGTSPESASLAELEEACSILNGEFLAGLDLPSCYRFYHWCMAERERWGAMRRRILSLVVERLADNPERALPYARAMVAADPLSELSHGRLVNLLAKLGRHSDAQDHFAYARKMLQREMDAPLVGDLRAPQIMHGGNSPERAVEVEANVSPLPSLSVSTNTAAHSLIGRVKEKEAITASLNALFANAEYGAMLFMGELGIGKSRLLELAAKQAVEKNACVIVTRCFEAEAVRPYGCWVDALGTVISQTTDPTLRHDLGPFLSPHELPENDRGSRTRLFDTVVTLLATLAGRRPLVLIIDDLQWIDEASSSLLHYVLRAAGRFSHFLFVGSARPDELDDNQWSQRVISSLGHHGAFHRINVAPLGADEVAQFLSAKPNFPEITNALKESGGNPLFLVEMANARLHGQRISGQNLDTLISDRLARLSVSERDIVIFASATSRDFKPELLGAAMDLPELQLMKRIEWLERRGLFKPSGEGRFDFAHDLIRQTTYRDLSQPRRRLIHRQFALALQVAARTDSSLAGELAYHAGASGDHTLAVQACIASGDYCLRLFANTAAVDAADRGLSHLAQLPVGVESARYHLALLKVKVFAGASPGVRMKPKLLVELQRAIEVADLLGLHDHDAALGWHMGWSALYANDTSIARQAIQRAEQSYHQVDELKRCQQLASTARCLLEVECDVQQARVFLDEAGRLAESLDHKFAELEWARGLVARWDGDLIKAQDLMRRALMLARIREDRWREIECLVWMAKIAVELNDVSGTISWCDEIDAVAARIGDGAAPVAAALRVLASIADSKSPAKTQFDLPLPALRALDDKAQLAYILNQFAANFLKHDFVQNAHSAATEALGAAQAVNRATEIIVAASILACTKTGLDAQIEALGTVETVIANIGGDALLSVRAQSHLDQARKRLKITTPIQTHSS